MATWTTKKSKIDEALKEGGYASAQDWYKQNNWKYSTTKGMSDQAYEKLLSQNVAKNTVTTSNGTTVTPITETATNPYQSQDVNTIYNALKSQLQTDAGTAPTYSSKWTDLVDTLSNNYLNMTYDNYLSSDAYKALQNQYEYNGNLASKNTLGQVAAQTGGLASSYATTAATMANNDYMTKLLDAARSAYNNERTDAYNNAMLAITNEQNDYGKYQDQLNQYNNNLNTIYSLLGDAINTSNTNASNAYNQALSAAQLSGDYSGMGDYMTYAQINQANENSQYDKLLSQAETLAAYGDFSGYKALGYTDKQIAQMKSAYQAAQKSSSSSKKGTTKKTSTITAAQAKSSLNDGDVSEDILEVYKKNYGSTKLYKNSVATLFEDALKKAQSYVSLANKGGNAKMSAKSATASAISIIEQATSNDEYQEILFDILGI